MTTHRTKTKKHLLFPFLAAALISFPAYPQATTIAADALIENVAHDITSSLNSTIKQLESSATVTTFNARSDLLVVLENVKNVSSALIGKTFSELNNSQKDFFERISKFTKETQDGVEITTERIDGLVNDLGDSLARIPGANRSPYVTKYTPSYFLGSDTPKDIVIKGTLIGTGKPTLSFGEIKCSKKTQTERELRFECPAEIFPNKEKWATGSLSVEEGRPWYASFLENKKKYYTISVASIPDKFAEFILETYTTEAITRYIDRAQDNGHMNEHCQGATPVAWTYTPSPGCSIDITSVSAPAGVSSQSTYNGIQSLTGTGFLVTGVVRNNGSCAPRIFGQRAYWDGRGSIGVTARWKDICTSSEEKPQPVQSGNLSWRSQLSLQLPKNLSKFVLTIKQINGEIHIITGSGSHKWFSTEFDREAKILVVRPTPLELALR